VLVQEVMDYLVQRGFSNREEIEVVPENVRFALPPEIVEAIGAAPPLPNGERTNEVAFSPRSAE